MERVLEVQNLQKAYGKTTALKGITFSVRAGTCFGLLGPNGAGKSTTMKILTGIVDADGGEARILGLDTTRDQTAIRRQVGYVPQNITLYEKLSAQDNLLFFGAMYGLSGRELEKRIAEVLKQIGLESRSKDLVNGFSGGMKRRINMAAAMLHRPKLLILDEPTVGIDPQSRNHIFELIRELKEQGVTIIYSTHYMEEVEALCDDVAIIDQGMVVAQGSLKELLDRFGNKAIFVEAAGFETLPSVPSATNQYRKGSGWVIETTDVMNGLRHILDNATRCGIEIQAMEITHPSLESVFLSLTGTSLRD